MRRSDTMILRRFIIFLALLSPTSFAALPATDSFTDSNGTHLADHGTSWTQNNGIHDIISNACSPDDLADNLAHWNADSFANDQYAQATVVGLHSVAKIGVAVRVAAAAANGYGLIYNNSNIRIVRSDTGTFTTLGATFTVPSATDKIRLEISGTTLDYLLDTGGGFVSQGTRTDATYSSGSAGVAGEGNSGSASIDDWEGGDLAGGGGSPLRRRRSN